MERPTEVLQGALQGILSREPRLPQRLPALEGSTARECYGFLPEGWPVRLADDEPLVDPRGGRSMPVREWLISVTSRAMSGRCRFPYQSTGILRGIIVR